MPKTVVHAFRTVVTDDGANIGFMISRSGFQKGAYEAAEKSNVHLVDWYEFQALFLERWKEGRYAGLRPLFEEHFDFYDFLSKPILNAISGDESAREYNLLRER